MKSARFAAVLALLSIAGALPARASHPDPATTAANVTRATTTLLADSQFSHHPLDAQLAAKLMERYLDALDGGRSLFLRTDADEFAAAYGKTLAEATRTGGDTRPATAIFKRYRERLAQRARYQEQLLRAAPLDFSGDDRWVFDREHAERPRDLAAAQALWRQELRAEALQERLSDKPPADIAAALTRRHQQRLRTTDAMAESEVVDVYLNALAHVYDPHSDYLGPEALQSMSIAMNLSLVGVGASLSNEDGFCVVRELLPGGPAAKSGVVKPGDRIVAVGQGSAPAVDITDLPPGRVVELIRGPKGTVVALTLLPPVGTAGAPRTVHIVREEIKLEDQQAKARLVELPRAGQPALRVGVIDLPSFYEGATAHVARLLVRLKGEGVAGVLLDLRRNGGGSLQEAIDLTGLFIKRGPVVQTRDARNAVEVDADRDPAVAFDGPLVVLTSRFSASASEILSGALQDYGRAVVAGDSATFGKGTVQTILPLAAVMDQMGLGYDHDPGALKVTVRKFYRPSGASTELRGVAADIVLPSSTEVAGISEAKLTDPLPWDTVPATPFDRLNRVAPYLASLRSASAQRIAANPGFAELRGKIADLKARQAAGSVSLNEAARRREQAADKARDLAIAEAGKAAEVGRPSYEITVKDAARPGRAAVPPRAAAQAARGQDLDQIPGDELVMNEALSILADYAAQTTKAAAGAQASNTRQARTP
jgi:carboxyl-terminal processing protease